MSYLGIHEFLYIEKAFQWHYKKWYTPPGRCVHVLQCLVVLVGKGNMVPGGAIQGASRGVSSITCSCNT